MTGTTRPTATDIDNWQRSFDALCERLLTLGGDRIIPDAELGDESQEFLDPARVPAKHIPSLKAAWEFLRARADYAFDDCKDAIARLRRCCDTWQTEKNPAGWQKLAVAQAHLGVCCRDSQDWEGAQQAYEICLTACERLGRTDVALGYAEVLATLLQKDERWGALQQLVERSLQWPGVSEAKGTRWARIKGWQARVALHQHRWSDAARTAQKAIDVLESEPTGVYRLLLAQARLHLGQPALARESWTAAIALGAGTDPSGYRQELEALQTACYDCGDYGAAGDLERTRYRYERQTGLRAFVGAMSLPAMDAALVPGREAELAALLDCFDNGVTTPNRPILLYGPHQAGKRSLLDAGLVPTLEDRGWQVLRTHNCQQWTAELGSALTGQRGRHRIETPQVLWERLQDLPSDRPIALIFDRLESFTDWPTLCAFLERCLQNPYLRVLLSFREAALPTAISALNGSRLVDLDRLFRLDYLSTVQAISALRALGVAPSASDRLARELTNDRGCVLPLRLQLAGLQLESDGYASRSTDELLARHLARVVAACGPERADATWLTLYVLLDPDNPDRGDRVRKTQAELARAVEHYQAGASEDLDEILKIVVGAGVLWQRSELPVTRYELTSPAFTAPIRQAGEQCCARIAQAQRETRKGRQQTRDFTTIGTTIAATVVVGLAGLWGWQEFVRFRDRPLHDARVLALSAYSRELSQSERPFTALVAALRAARPLQAGQMRLRSLASSARLKLAVALHDALYTVRERNHLGGHDGAVNAVAIAPDGETIVSAGADGGVLLWQMDGKLQQALIAPDPVDGGDRAFNAVAITPDGQTIITAGLDGDLRMWDGSGSQGRRIPIGDEVTSLAVAPDGALAVGTVAGELVLLDAAGQILQRRRVHQAPIQALAFSQDGAWLATASQDRTAKVFNRQGQWQATLQGHSGWVNGVAFNADAETIATASGDGTIGFWSRQGERLDSLVLHEGTVTSVTFSPDGRYLASTSSDRTVRIWDERGELLQTLVGHTDTVAAVAWSPDSETLASASRDRSVKLWEPAGARPPSLAAHPREVSGLAFSPDGKLMASASWDGTVRLWNRTGELLRTLDGHHGAVNRIAFAPDGQTFVSTGIDGTARIWNRRGEELETLTAHTDWAVAAAFTPNGKTFATAGWDGTVKLWDRGGNLEQTLTIAPTTDTREPNALAVTFSPDGELVAVGGSDRAVHLWQRDGTLLHSLQGHVGPVYGVAFSPEGDLLATASLDRTIKLWRASDGLELLTLRGHQGGVFDVTFSPDGQLLATASSDGTVKLWNRDGNELLTLTGAGAPVYALAFAPDSKILAAANYDGTIGLWDLGLESLLVRGCAWVDDYRRSQDDRAIARLCPGYSPP